MAGVNYVMVLADTSDESRTNPSGPHEGWTTEGKHVYWEENSGFTGSNNWFQGPYNISFGETSSMAHGPLEGMKDPDIEQYIEDHGNLDLLFNNWATNVTYTDTERSNWVLYVENSTSGCVQEV